MPPVVIPVIVMTLLVPMAAVANVPAKDVRSMVTVSPLITPEKPALVVTSCDVAEVLPLYPRLTAVMPVTVKAFGVILAVVVGWMTE